MTLSASNFHQRFQSIHIQQDLNSRQLADTVTALVNRYAKYLARITVNPTQVVEVKERIASLGISLGTVAGYPLGNLHLDVKAVQLQAACQAGADHVDIVLPIEHLLDGRCEQAEEEVHTLTALSRELGLSAAWVANLAFLDEAQRRQAVDIIARAGVPLVTNSGFNNQTQLADLTAILEFDSQIAITACGGIDSAEQAAAYLAGGTRLVASHSALDLLTGLETLLAYSE